MPSPKSPCRRTWFSIRFTFMPATRTVTGIAKNWSGRWKPSWPTTGSSPLVGDRDRGETLQLVLRFCVLVQVGLSRRSWALTLETHPHRGSRQPSRRASQPRNLSPGQPLSRSGRAHLGPEPAWTFSVAMDEAEALGMVSPESGLTREGQRSIRTAPASRLDLLCLASWKKRDRERREV